MKISLATPEKLIFSGEGDDILLHTEEGQIEVLERHTNFITLVKPGSIHIRGTGDGEKKFHLGEGVMKIEDNQVSVLCRDISI